MSRASAAARTARRLIADGRYFAYLAFGRKKASGLMTQPVIGISPYEAAVHSGRLHEREDVLSYLTLLAVSTKDETLWEAVRHIKDGKHRK